MLKAVAATPQRESLRDSIKGRYRKGVILVVTKIQSSEASGMVTWLLCLYSLTWISLPMG